MKKTHSKKLTYVSYRYHKTSKEITYKVFETKPEYNFKDEYYYFTYIVQINRWNNIQCLAINNDVLKAFTAVKKIHFMISLFLEVKPLYDARKKLEAIEDEVKPLPRIKINLNEYKDGTLEFEKRLHSLQSKFDKRDHRVDTIC